MEDAEGALPATVKSWESVEFIGQRSPASVQKEEEEEEEAVCVSAGRGAGHSPALLSASDWMRDAQGGEKEPRRWFDSQTRAGAEDAPVWKSGHARRLSRGRKHANEDTLQKGKLFQMTVSVETIKGCNVAYSRFPREISSKIRNVRLKTTQKEKSVNLVPHWHPSVL